MDHAQLALQHIQKRTLVAEHVPLVSLTVWLDLCYAADKATDKPTYKKMFSQVMAINEAQGKINDALAKLEPVKSMELDSKDLKALWQVFVVRPQRDRVVWETIESLVDTRDDLCDEFLETMAAFIQQPTELWTLPKTIEIPLPETSDLLADPTKLEPWIAKAKLDTWEDAIELQVVAATKLYEALGKQQQASFPGLTLKTGQGQTSTSETKQDVEQKAQTAPFSGVWEYVFGETEQTKRLKEATRKARDALLQSQREVQQLETRLAEQTLQTTTQSTEVASTVQQWQAAAEAAERAKELANLQVIDVEQRISQCNALVQSYERNTTGNVASLIAVSPDGVDHRTTNLVCSRLKFPPVDKISALEIRMSEANARDLEKAFDSVAPPIESVKLTVVKPQEGMTRPKAWDDGLVLRKSIQSSIDTSFVPAFNWLKTSLAMAEVAEPLKRTFVAWNASTQMDYFAQRSTMPNSEVPDDLRDIFNYLAHEYGVNPKELKDVKMADDTRRTVQREAQLMVDQSTGKARQSPVNATGRFRQMISDWKVWLSSSRLAKYVKWVYEFATSPVPPILMTAYAMWKLDVGIILDVATKAFDPSMALSWGMLFALSPNMVQALLRVLLKAKGVPKMNAIAVDICMDLGTAVVHASNVYNLQQAMINAGYSGELQHSATHTTVVDMLAKDVSVREQVFAVNVNVAFFLIRLLQSSSGKDLLDWIGRVANISSESKRTDAVNEMAQSVITSMPAGSTDKTYQSLRKYVVLAGKELIASAIQPRLTTEGKERKESDGGFAQTEFQFVEHVNVSGFFLKIGANSVTTDADEKSWYKMLHSMTSSIVVQQATVTTSTPARQTTSRTEQKETKTQVKQEGKQEVKREFKSPGLQSTSTTQPRSSEFPSASRQPTGSVKQEPGLRPDVKQATVGQTPAQESKIPHLEEDPFQQIPEWQREAVLGAQTRSTTQSSSQADVDELLSKMDRSNFGWKRGGL